MSHVLSIVNMRKRIERGGTYKQVRKNASTKGKVKITSLLPVNSHVGTNFLKKLHCQPSSEESFRYIEEAAGWHKPEDRGGREEIIWSTAELSNK